MSAAAIFDTLLEASARAVLVAGFVAIALVVFRAKAPALRHAVWTAALAIMLALPLTSAWLPAVPLPMWLPAPSVTRVTAITGQAAVVPDSIPAPPAMPSSPQAMPSGVLTAPPSEPLVTARSASMPAASPGRDWRTNAVAAWLLVAGVLLLRQAIGWRLARRLVCKGVPAAVGDGTYESERVTTPVVTG